MALISRRHAAYVIKGMFVLIEISVFLLFFTNESALKAADLSVFNDVQANQPPVSVGLGGLGKSTFITQGVLSYSLHQIESHPPGSYQYDTRLQGSAQMRGLGALGSGAFFAWGLNGAWQQNELSDSLNTDSLTTSKSSALGLSLHVQTQLSNGLEVFISPQILFLPRYNVKTQSTLTSLSTTYKSSLPYWFSVGFLKRSSSYAAGPYFSFSQNTKRSFVQTASDSTSFSGTENLFVPSALGVIAKIQFSDVNWETMISLIKSGDNPTKTTAGLVMFDDSLSFWNQFMLNTAAGEFRGVFALQTGSFADQGYMSIDNISTWRGELGSSLPFSPNPIVSLGCVFGKDRQSLPQLNADYRHLTLYIRASLF